MTVPRSQPHREKPGQARPKPKAQLSDVARVLIEQDGKWWDAFAGVYRTKEDL